MNRFGFWIKLTNIIFGQVRVGGKKGRPAFGHDTILKIYSIWHFRIKNGFLLYKNHKSNRFFKSSTGSKVGFCQNAQSASYLSPNIIESFTKMRDHHSSSLKKNFRLVFVIIIHIFILIFFIINTLIRKSFSIQINI